MIYYKAKRNFEYNGIKHKPGDIWEPAGGKWDKQIKEHLVIIVEDEPKAKKAVSSGNKRK